MPDQHQPRSPPCGGSYPHDPGEVKMSCHVLAVVMHDGGFAQWSGYPPIPKLGDWVTLLECVGKPGSRALDCDTFRVTGGTWGGSKDDLVYRLIIDLETGERPQEEHPWEH